MEKGREVRERCDFRYIPLHDESDTDQVVSIPLLCGLSGLSYLI
jgi:hypothetical protein